VLQNFKIDTYTMRVFHDRNTMPMDSGITLMAEEFAQSGTIVTLGLTFYLFGLAIGSMFGH
jgi:hypothetical protein